jgi:SRSO17 transposase
VLRERVVGPATTITKTATTAQTKASNHDWRIESAPENIGEKKLPETALFAACISMMISTLPPVLLKTQLKTITAARISTMSE